MEPRIVKSAVEYRVVRNHGPAHGKLQPLSAACYGTKFNHRNQQKTIANAGPPRQRNLQLNYSPGALLRCRGPSCPILAPGTVLAPTLNATAECRVTRSGRLREQPISHGWRKGGLGSAVPNIQCCSLAGHNLRRAPHRHLAQRPQGGRLLLHRPRKPERQVQLPLGLRAHHRGHRRGHRRGVRNVAAVL